jgi:hypothetical protein
MDGWWELSNDKRLSAPLPSAKEWRTIMPDPVVYRSQVRIERVKGPHRRAYLPVKENPVHFGVHSAVAAHYGVDPEIHEPRDTTLDYLVAAAAG